MRKLIGRLICWRVGHLRGKRIDSLDGATKRFQCGRCGRITEYRSQGARAQ